MSILGRRLSEFIDAAVTGRPPHVIERQFGWLRDLGYQAAESGTRRMEIYTTYASKDVLVRILEEYHYGFVGVWLARAPAAEGDEAGRDVALKSLLAVRAPEVRWDENYYDDEGGAGEMKLAEAARLLREHCADLVRGENLEVLESGA